MGVAVIEDLADLRRSFSRLLGISVDDDFSAYDSEEQETIHHYLQQGLWNAQYWLLTHTPYRGWLTSASLTLSSEDARGERTADLPSDFLRLDGTRRRSGLRYADGTRWGVLVGPEDFRKAWGNYYTIENDQIVVSKGATITGTLEIDYHFYHPELTEAGVTLNFPKLDRHLIPAEAAVLAMNDGWVPFESDSEREAIVTALAHRRQVAGSRARRDKQPAMVRIPGSSWGPRWLW